MVKIIKVVANVRDMKKFVTDMKNSYAEKRNAYNEFQTQVSVRGFVYSKQDFTREKYPKFPRQLRDQIAKMI